MRHTNKYMKGGTAIIIAAGLGLSSTALSSDSSEPIKEAVKTISEKIETPAAKLDVPIKLAEAPSVQPAVKADLAPMRLRMSLDLTEAQIRQIETHRQGHVKGDKESLAKLGAFSKNIFQGKRFQVTISNGGDNLIEISNGAGGWPGFPITNTNWKKRGLSADMQHGLKAITDRCRGTTKPSRFMAALNDGDIDIVKSDNYEVECVPGDTSQRARFTYADYAQAYLDAEGPSLEDRQHLANQHAHFGMMIEYVLKTSNGSLAQDRLECVKIQKKLKQDYGFTQRYRDLADLGLAKCPTANLNWIRRRNGLPEVQ